MKTLATLITILFMSLLSSPSWSEDYVIKNHGWLDAPIDWSDIVSMDDLVERNNLFYKKFTDVPFTGEVSGISEEFFGKMSGKFKNGKKEGEWLSYNSGQLVGIDNYKDGKRDGIFEIYHENGGLRNKGIYKDGKHEDGLSITYHKNGQISIKCNYKDGDLVGLWEDYYENGQLRYSGSYKEGKYDGLWKLYDEDGSLKETRTYKDGELVD